MRVEQEEMLRAYARNAVDRTELEAAISALLDERDALVDFASWVDSWVSNPVTSYSVDALDGLFGLTRDRLEALSRAGRQEDG